MNLYECGKVVFVRLRKDLGFFQTGNFGFCTINKNSIGALLPCCEKICPLGLKVFNEKNNKGGMIEMAENEKDTDEKVENFMQEFHTHGMGCGTKIAELAKEMHPGAIAIIPLYRSCIVIEQDAGDKKEGDCTIHAYADPHWLGGEIDIETLKSEEFHSVYHVQGDRQGPVIVQFSGKKR